MSPLRAVATACLLLVLLVIVLFPLTRTRSRGARVGAALGVLALGGIWFLANEPVEGEVLVDVTRSHGLTTGDLPSLAAVVLAVAILAWPRRRGERRREV